MNEYKPLLREISDASLEQQMDDCDLSHDARQFLRDLHAAEKQLNDAFRRAHQGGALEERVSAVYRRMYGKG
jgi:hypothetical protein